MEGIQWAEEERVASWSFKRVVSGQNRGKLYATLLNILQLKRATGRRRKPRKKGWELVMQGMRGRTFGIPPVPHPSHHST